MRVSACANMLRGNRSKVPPTLSEENLDYDHPESPSLEKRVALGSGRGPNGSPFELGGRNQWICRRRFPQYLVHVQLIVKMFR